jgi:hypothetical protein
MIEQEELNKFIYTSQLKEKLDSFGQDFSAKDDVFTKRTKVLAVLNQILDPETTTVSTDLSDLDPEVFRALIAYALHDTTAPSIVNPIVDKILSIISLEIQKIHRETEPPEILHFPAFAEMLENLPEPYICNELVQDMLNDLNELNTIMVKKAFGEMESEH